MVKNPTYTGITPRFWAQLDMLAGESEWVHWGTPNCGKGQPMQVAHTGHSAAPGRFAEVRVGGQGMTDARSAADRLVEIVGKRAEAEATVAVGRAELTRFANSFIHQNVGEEYVNVRLRVAAGGRVATVTGNRADDAALSKLAEDALVVAATQPVDEDWAGLTAPTTIAPADFSHKSTTAATPAGRAATVKSFVGAGEGLLAAGFCDTDSFETAFANSLGHRAAARGSRATIDGIHQTGESAGSAHQTSNAFSDLDGAAAGALAADRARRGLHAFDLKPGDYEVVLAPEPVATIAVFLDFYGLNGKAFNEGQSFVELGAAQFDERITVVDDPMGPGALGEAYDAEGTPKQSTVLIDRGITRTVVHDRRSGRRAGVASTGHAWAMSGSLGPFAGHVVVQPGSDTVDDMIAAVERGCMSPPSTTAASSTPRARWSPVSPATAPS